MLLITIFTVEAVQFNCDFNLHTFTTISGYVYTCKATVKLTETTTLESISGTHPWGNINDDVEGLWINTQILTFFPQKIDSFFKYLRAFRYENSNIRAMNAEDLRPFSQLEHLSLIGNGLISLDSNLFSFSPLLKYLNMNDNRIQHIGHDLVTNLNYLQQLYLQSNFCISKYATTRATVIDLASQLSDLCPPLDETTTVATTIGYSTTESPNSSTTDRTNDQCSCDEIEELYGVVQEQNRTIASIEGRLLEVEKKLLGIIPQ